MNHHHDCDHHHDHSHDHPAHDHDEDQDEEVATYMEHGVRFRYPRNWTVTEEPGPDEITISVQSPATSFWSVTLFADRPEPEYIIKTVLGAYTEEYGDLDVYDRTYPMMDVISVARDIDFVCLDVVNSVSLIAFQTDERSILIVSQGTDRELETSRSVMESMTQSLSCQESML